jgi:cytochrome c biogenesis protein CcdA
VDREFLDTRQRNLIWCVYNTAKSTPHTAMILLVLAFLGGMLTIISPCVLPVLPFVFARANQPFRKSALPLLAGMAVTFVALAAAATVGGGWVVRANQYGRVASLIGLARGLNNRSLTAFKPTVKTKSQA